MGITRKSKAGDQEDSTRGASRRDFLAGAGLTGVAVALSTPWPAAAADSGSARLSSSGSKEGQGNNQSPGASPPGHYGLELDGVAAGRPASVDGGNPYADVVSEKPGNDGVARKHIAGVKYEDISVSCRTGMSSAFYGWIRDSFDGKTERKSISVIFIADDGAEVGRLNGFNTWVSELTMPALDIASTAPALMTVKLTPAKTQLAAGGQARYPPRGEQKKWLPANFRLRIDGVDCTGVATVDGVTLKQKNTEHAVGEMRAYEREFSNLVITTDAAHAGDFYKWVEDFVVRGKNDQGDEKAGSLEYLAADGSLLFTLAFGNVGIFKLDLVTAEVNGRARKRLKAEMYCETISFQAAPASSA